MIHLHPGQISKQLCSVKETRQNSMYWMVPNSGEIPVNVSNSSKCKWMVKESRLVLGGGGGHKEEKLWGDQHVHCLGLGKGCTQAQADQSSHFDKKHRRSDPGKAAKRKQSCLSGQGAPEGPKEQGQGDRPSVSGSPPSWAESQLHVGWMRPARGFI